MLDNFFTLYAKSFKYTGGDMMKTFLGMEVEQSHGKIQLHLDTYVQEVIDDYKAVIKKDLNLKQVPMQPGVILTNDDCPETPDPREQKLYRSCLAKVQFVAQWIRYDVSFATSQLARFLRISRPVTLGHLMGYLSYQSSFKLTYRKGINTGFDGFADSMCLGGRTMCLGL